MVINRVVTVRRQDFGVFTLSLMLHNPSPVFL